MGYTRKSVKFKAYCCLFICLSSQAVHLEVCTSLETEEFLAAFQRFCDRRGTPHSVYSDNGSNFVGAKAELQAIRRMLQRSEKAISHLSSTKELQWHTIPPRSPHHRGLWEAAVREMKRLLRMQVPPHPFRLDEFQTLLTGIEASLNSRPLVDLGTTEPEDNLTLTPAHFLIFRPLLAPPTKPTSKVKLPAWQGYYLTQLQARSKWRKGSNHVYLCWGHCLRQRRDTSKRKMASGLGCCYIPWPRQQDNGCRHPLQRPHLQAKCAVSSEGLLGGL